MSQQTYSSLHQAKETMIARTTQLFNLRTLASSPVKSKGDEQRNKRSRAQASIVSCRKNKTSIRNITACNANTALHPNVRRTRQTSDVTAQVTQNSKEIRVNPREVTAILAPLLCCFHISNTEPLLAKPATDTPLTTSKINVDSTAMPVIKLRLPDFLIHSALYSTIATGSAMKTTVSMLAALLRRRLQKLGERIHVQNISALIVG